MHGFYLTIIAIITKAATIKETTIAKNTKRRTGPDSGSQTTSVRTGSRRRRRSRCGVATDASLGFGLLPLFISPA
jgi:hypothetical protein